MPQKSSAAAPAASFPLARCRQFHESDYEQLAALDLAFQRQQDAQFDQHPERERLGRLSTSLPALQFYKRSEHSFVAEYPNPSATDDVPNDATNDVPNGILGFAFAQSVWQGDKPLVLVRSVVVDPQLDDDHAGQIAAHLLKAVVKSAYDTAVYEVHFLQTPLLKHATDQEEALQKGEYAVVYLGSRAQTTRT